VNFLWVAFTLLGAAGQTARNTMQRELTPKLGALGATLVRFLFGFPFALIFLATVMLATGAALPKTNPDFALWTALGALTQIGGTALMLKTMEQRSFVVTVAYLKTEPVLVALMGLTFLHDPLTLPMALAIGAAMVGVALISVKPQALTGGLKPALLGLSSAALFAASAIGYRGAILSLHQTSFVLGATFSLAAGLTCRLCCCWPGCCCSGGGRSATFSGCGNRHWQPVSRARRRRSSGSWPSRWRLQRACARWRWWKCCSRRA
jgi:drug/metabolite transporter (DMT)-like permease